MGAEYGLSLKSPKGAPSFSLYQIRNQEAKKMSSDNFRRNELKNNLPILLIEDDQVDVMTVQRALKDLKVTNPLEIACDGEQGLAYLENPATVNPCIIF